MNNFGQFIDIDIDIDTIPEYNFEYKKKNSDDNIIIKSNNNNIYPNNKTQKYIIFCICGIITYYFCYIIHHWNY